MTFEILTFKPKPSAIDAEAELLNAIKNEIYMYSGTLSVVQVVGLLEVCKDEILREQS